MRSMNNLDYIIEQLSQANPNTEEGQQLLKMLQELQQQSIQQQQAPQRGVRPPAAALANIQTVLQKKKSPVRDELKQTLQDQVASLQGKPMSDKRSQIMGSIQQAKAQVQQLMGIQSQSQPQIPQANPQAARPMMETVPGPLNGRLLQNDQANRQNGMYTTMAQDMRGTTQRPVDLTKYYTSNEIKQLNEARRKDEQVKFGLNKPWFGYGKDEEAKQKKWEDNLAAERAKGPNYNEIQTRAKLDADVRSRLSSSNAGPNAAASKAAPQDKAAPSSSAVDANAELNNQRLAGDKANARDASLNPFLAADLSLQAQKANPNLSESEIQSLIPDMMEGMHNGKSMADVLKSANKMGRDRRMEELKMQRDELKLKSEIGDALGVDKPGEDIKPVGTAEQNRIDAANGARSEMVLTISSLQDKFDPAFFNELQQKKFLGIRQINRILGDNTFDEKTRIAAQKYKDFAMSMEQLFNSYRKDITGAAASEQELLRLQKAFANMDLSADEARIALQGLKSLAVMKNLLANRRRDDRSFDVEINDYLKQLPDKIKSGQGLTKFDKRMWNEMQQWEKVRNTVLKPREERAQSEYDARLDKALKARGL